MLVTKQFFKYLHNESSRLTHSITIEGHIGVALLPVPNYAKHEHDVTQRLEQDVLTTGQMEAWRVRNGSVLLRY